MAKIFEYKAGSFIEQVSKRVATSVNLTHKRTEKGVACVFNSATSSLLFPNTSNLNIPTGTVRTFVFNADLKFNSSRTSLFGKRISSAAFGSAPGYILFPNVEVGHIHIMIDDGANAIYLDSGIVFNHKLNHYIFTVDRVNNVMYLECNGVKGTEISIASLTANVTNDFDFGFKTYQSTNKPFADVLDLKVYDHILSAKERTDLYRDFLQSQITEKPVRGFELVKPNDLSYLKDTGLVAAYNMKPNGNTLVDISGNGNNGTIVGALRTKDGMSFVTNNKGISVSNLGTFTNLTINLSFKDITGLTNWHYLLDYRPKGTYLALTSMINFGLFMNGVTLVEASEYNRFETNNISLVMLNAETKVYLNGTHLRTVASMPRDFTSGLIIGSRYAIDSSWQTFNGEIQDIRFYNRVLTEQEIKDYHNSFITPVLLIDFSNEAVGNTI